MLDKTRLGTRYTCFQCQTKFYDLNRAVPNCPECEADQREAPTRDIKSLLSKGGRKRKIQVEEEEEPKPVVTDSEEEEEEEEEEEGEMTLLGDEEDL